jgi:Tfp pilus assembly protein PilN
MANLLPNSFREDIASEYKLRLATAGLTLLAVIFLAATALLAPSFILTESRLEQKQATLDSLSAGTSSTSTQQSQDIIARTNEKLSVVTQSSEQLAPTDIIKLITATRPGGVSVRRISLQNADAEDVEAQTINITGIAETRDALLQFEENLSNRAQTQEVDLPIETLASQQNAEFSLTVTVKSL